MSKIRVYELAKEAGMSSKALAERLKEEGYDIKGHSSSVDEETATRIRNTILKTADTELVEKRIDSEKNRPTVIRRRATVIRRRPKEVVEEPQEQEESFDQVTEEVVPVETPEPEIDAEIEAVAEEQQEVPEDKVIEEPILEKPAIQEEEAQPEDKEEIEQASPVESEQVEELVLQEAVEEVPAPKESQEKKPLEEPVARKDTGKGKSKKSTVKKMQGRKPMARIVRTIELPTAEPTPPPAPRPKKRSPRPVGSHEPVAPGLADTGPKKEDTGRARKKGKKGVTTEDKSDFRKGGKKTQKNVKFTHFGADYAGREGGRRRKKGKRSRPTPPPSEMKASKKRFKVYDTITVGDLALKMKVKASEIIAKLMGLGVMATINQPVDTDTAILIAADFGYEVEQGMTEELGIQMVNEAEEGGEKKPRPPVVTVMGHVDHGKTSILDAIRKSDVAAGEAGGITQHIGAYLVRSSAGDVTFVDTPGHAAFTEMRSRGAQVTDIVILVVAADDGVMDQTREAISHSQAAGVPIIVAVNKIDKDNADIDRVKRELSELDLMPEDWGGETIYCETSAKQNIGIDGLMESIQLMAEMLELEADSERKAKGRVIEAQLHKGRGAVATVLIQEGTLQLGDNFVVGQFHGKVRAMLNHNGKPLEEAGPSIPVEVQGLAGVPSAGDEFIVVTDEKMARSVSQKRSLKARESELGSKTKISLDKLFEQMSEGDVQELRVVLRADVQGTLEAFAKAAQDLSTKDIKVRVLHEGTGTITESDILLASASDAIIIGFNVRPSVKVKELAATENVDLRAYNVI